MKLGIVSGSPRGGSQTGLLADALAHRLPRRQRRVEPVMMDLSTISVPSIESVISGAYDGGDSWQKVRDAMSACDGLIVLSPEYNGMVPPALKAFFLVLGRDVLGDKPALAVGVSEGAGGVWPVAELKMTTTKGTGLCWLPDEMVVRRVSEVNEAVKKAIAGEQKFPRIWGVLDEAAGRLVAYAQALGAMRAAQQTANTAPATAN
jgi:NAD(P)H-dependent FMN reductase